jgi:ABC-type phosphate transport system permease subunit
MAATRHERRIKRKRTEEVMSWFLLPAIVVVVYFIGVVAWTNLREAIPALSDLKAIQDKVRR